MESNINSKESLKKSERKVVHAENVLHGELGIKSEKTKNIKDISILDLLGVLISHRFLIFGITLLAAFTIFTVCIISILLPPEKSFLPNEFTPEAHVLIKEKSGNSGMASQLSAFGLGNLGAMYSGAKNSDLTLTLAVSNTMLDNLISDFDLSNHYKVESKNRQKTNTRNIIRSRIQLTVDDSTGIITIGYRDIDPQLATNIVNRIVFLLKARFDSIDHASTISQQELILKKLDTVSVEIDEIERKMLDFQNQNKILDANVVANEISTQVIQLKGKMIKLDTELEALRKRFGNTNSLVNEKIWEKEAIAKQVRVLETQGSYQLPAMNNMPDLLLEFHKLRREISIKSSLFSELQRQLEVNKLSAQGVGEVFQLLESSEFPEVKSGPSRGKLCILVTMAAFFLAVFAAFVMEFLREMIRDPESIERLRIDQHWLFKNRKFKKFLGLK